MDAATIGLNPLRVLVADDEKNIRATMSLALESAGCEVVQASTSEGALAAVTQKQFDLAFVDLRLAGESGLDVLARLVADQPRLDVVMITAYGTIDVAVEAMKRGARDFLPKPFTPAQIRHAMQRTRERCALEMQVESLHARLSEAAPEDDLASSSPAMLATLELARKAAGHDVPVLLLGESGTGKGVLARAIHRMSARHAMPFVTVNCPTLSEDLLASELFGHARGAFTGAIRDQPGRVEAADGGTLFLDEIGELPPSLQAKLLRFLQDRKFERLGENLTRTADLRVIAATNRNLEQEVADRRFREDLYFRLNTVELTLPPLRARREDLLPLARGFLEFFARNMRRPTPGLSEEVEHLFSAYGWPGNVRELRNTIERAMIFTSGPLLDRDSLPVRLIGAERLGSNVGGDCTLEELERDHILRVIGRTSSLEDAARILGIDASTLYRKRKRYDPAP